jgi:2-amino-4-hydroxy-6-hydroxymethyldihydropteridine diphosphokinase
MKTVYLSLGSNLGDRQANLEEALRRLESPRLRVIRRSSFYETEPVGLTGQPWFLNLVAEAETTLFPMMLLKRAEQIQREMGRKRVVKDGPRNIDIDVLLYGQFQVNSPKLTIPHPRMTGRRFVLAPMAELAPQLRHPVSRRTMKELLDRVERHQVWKL